ncbi:MAG: hypothetical protein ACLFUJ_06365 [Phycisphaerae bacterium]
MRSTLLPLVAIVAMSALFVAGCQDGDATLWPCAGDDQTAMDDQDGSPKSTGRQDDDSSYASVDHTTGANGSSWMALPTGRKDSSVLLIEKMGPENVRAGQPFTYKIRVTNLTDMALKNVKIIEQIPDNFNVRSVDPKGKSQGDNRIWTWETFPASAQRTIEITGLMPETGQITNCTNAEWDYNPLCLNFAAVKPELELQLSGPDNTLICDPLVYMVTVKNTGDAPAKNVQLISRFPDRLQSLDGRRQLTHTIDTLDPGATKQLRIRAKAQRAATYDHSVSLQADGDINKDSNTVETNVVTPVLVVNVDAPEKRYVDRPIEYNIQLSNTGNAASTNTVLRHDLPDGVEFVSASDNGTHKNGMVMWQIGKLEVDQRREFTVRVRASRKGDLEASAKATAYCADASDATGTATTAVAGIPAVLLEMIDLADPVEVGGTETYEIRVTNQGSANDTNIVVTAMLPEEFKYVSSDGPTDGKRNGNTITFEPLDELAPKKQAIYTITATAQGTGDVRFRVRLNTDQTTKPVEESEATRIYE